MIYKITDYFKLFIIITFTSYISYSCVLNKNASTPKKAKPYPNFTRKDYLKGQLSDLRKSFDVTFYNLDIKFNLEEKSIDGKVDIYFDILKDLDTLQLDLFENMNIKSIEMDGESLNFSREYNTIWIEKHLTRGKSKIVTIEYNGKPLKAKKPPWDGGFVWKKDKSLSKNPWVSVACEEIGASLWWPLKDHLSDEPDSVQMSFTIPISESISCISNGKLVKTEDNDSLQTFTWKTSYPINTYNLTFYIGDFENFSVDYNSEYEDFKLDYYVLPYNLDKAKEHFKQTNKILTFYEKTFGAYPWPKDGFKLIESPFAGMEHQTAIAYGNGYKNEKYLEFDYIILHEVAHEWWGNAVSATDYADIWLHEGFATYSEALYVESTKGYQTYLNYLNIYSWFIKNKQPVVRVKDVNYWNEKDADVYMKGAMVLHTLREVLDDDKLFFDILKSFYSNFKYKNATTKDFMNLVNFKTGKNYDWFFNQYLFDRRVPILKYYSSYSRLDGFNVYYYWDNVNKDFKMPITFEDRNGDIEKYVITTTPRIINLDLSDEETSYFKLKKE